MAKKMEDSNTAHSADNGEDTSSHWIHSEEFGLADLLKDEHTNWICVWPDGTRCWLEDLEEYLIFMSDDFEVVAISNYDLQPSGLI